MAIRAILRGANGDAEKEDGLRLFSAWNIVFV